MRTIRNVANAVKEIKQQDPFSPINEHFLRTLVKTGAIPAVRSGKRIFIDMQVLEDYLANPLPVVAILECRR